MSAKHQKYFCAYILTYGPPFIEFFCVFSMVIKYFLVILLITSFKLITEASETSHLTTLIFSNQTSQTTAVGLNILCILLCSDGC